MSATHTAREQIDRAWRLRFDQRNEESFVEFVQLCSVLGLPSTKLRGVDLAASLKRDGEADALIDVITLGASLARSRAQHEEGEALLARLEAALESIGALPGYSVLLERGLFAYLRGDYSNAQEAFLLASHRTSDDLKKLVAETNALLCLENLGLPHEHTLGRVRRLRQKVGEAEGTRSVDSQLAAFALRAAFREGRIEEVLPDDGEPTLEQASYYRLWVAKLPYTSFSIPAERALEKLMHQPHFLFRRSYQVRTLQGLLSPDDLEPVMWSHWADRLYLWVWNWLVSPDHFPLARLLGLLKAPLEQHELAGLTAEDGQLVHNALLWLSLFDAHSGPVLPKALARLFPYRPSVEIPILELERLVIHGLLGLRDGQETAARGYLTQLSLHPLWSSSALGFRGLIESVLDESAAAPPRLDPLARQLRQLLSARSAPRAEVVVDLTRNEIRLGNAPPIVCEWSCRALEALHRDGSLSLEDFAAVVFGISRFDATIHAQRVFHLLRRLRELFAGRLVFRTKAGMVRCEGEWSDIAFHSRRRADQDLFHQPEWRALIYRREEGLKASPRGRGSLSRAELLSKASLTRRDIEALTGKSRASANRILADWEHRGWIHRAGAARATVYELGQELRNRLESGKEIL